jgi:hypothetical protein
MNSSVLLTLGLIASSSSLLSASLTQTFSHSTPQQGIPFTDNFTLPSFDISFGTLTAVTLSLANTTIGNVLVYNVSGVPQSFTNATASIPESLTSVGGTLTSSAVAGPLSGTAAPGLNSYSSVAGKSAATLDVNNLANFSTNTVVPLSFSLVSGIASFAGDTSAPGGTLFFGGDATVGSVTTIRYSYDDAPSGAAAEPGTWGLVATSSLAMIYAVRRQIVNPRRAKAGE